jgi:DNA polymerase-3 subunit epsilon
MSPTEDLRLERVTFVAFDTETTGLYPVVAKLVEIGAVRFDLGGEETVVFEQLIDPETPMPDDARRVNNISDHMVRGQPTVDQVLPAFIDFIDRPDHLLVAHNAVFDMEMIGVDLVRHAMPLPKHAVFDTRALARAIIPGLVSYSLEALAAVLGIKGDQKHRALADARQTKEVFLALVERMPRVETVGALSRVAMPLNFDGLGLGRAAPPPGLESLAAAIEESRAIEMIYAGGTRPNEPRKVTPRALLSSWGTLYLAAYCHTDAKEKVYRVDRIKSIAWPG